MTDSSWVGVIIVAVVILVFAYSPTIMGTVLGIGTILVPAVFVIAGFIFVVRSYQPPVWILALYVLCWLVLPSAALGFGLFAGLAGGFMLLLHSSEQE